MLQVGTLIPLNLPFGPTSGTVPGNLHRRIVFILTLCLGPRHIFAPSEAKYSLAATQRFVPGRRTPPIGWMRVYR